MQATWLFFDMGSTIMNETPAMEKRIRDTIAGTDITYEAFAAKMAEFRAMGMREDLAAFDYFGITERTPWPRDAEVPWQNARKCSWGVVPKIQNNDFEKVFTNPLHI